MRIAPFARAVRLGHRMSVDVVLVSFFSRALVPQKTGFTITRHLSSELYLHHTRPW